MPGGVRIARGKNDVAFSGVDVRAFEELLEELLRGGGLEEVLHDVDVVLVGLGLRTLPHDLGAGVEQVGRAHLLRIGLQVVLLSGKLENAGGTHVGPAMSLRVDPVVRIGQGVVVLVAQEARHLGMGLHDVVGLEERFLCDLPVALELDLVPPGDVHAFEVVAAEWHIDAVNRFLE